MIVEYVRTYLEMSGAADLRPAADVPAVRLEPVANQTPLLRELVDRIGAPHHWSERQASAAEWAEAMANPALQHWLFTIDGEPAGVGALEAQPHGNVEIVVFGLLPECVGRGYGGAALTKTIRLAWTRPPVDAEPIRRVWLHTSSLDHPHALPNYQRRGFRTFRTETRRKEIPTRTFPG